MKKIFYSAMLLMAGLAANAQVKVGNNPTTINTNSVLEIESTNKGLLLPRVALTGTANVAPLTAHVAGMTVYNTATAGNVTPGYYYNDGTKWVRIADAAAAGAEPWFNVATGTGATSNTQDIYQLGKVGIGTTSPVSFLHINKTGSPSGITTSYVDGMALTASSDASALSGPGFYFEAPNGTVGQKLLKTNFTKNSEGNSFLNFQAVSDDAAVAGASIMSLLHNGKVGFGTNSPKSFLHINRSGIASGIATSYVDGMALTASTDASALSGPGFYFEAPNGTVGQKLLKTNFTKNGEGNSFLNFQAVSDDAAVAGASIMSLLHNGKVGIGTTSPKSFLHINRTGGASGIATSYVDGMALTASTDASTLSGPGFYFEAPNGTVGQKLLKTNFTKNSEGNSFLNFQAVSDDAAVAGTAIMSLLHNGNVGFGTNIPKNILHINRSGIASGIAATYSDGMALTANTDASTLSGPGFYFEAPNGTVGQKLLKTNFTKNAEGNSFLNFQAVSDDAAVVGTAIMSLLHNGKVGIGTTSPKSFLHINRSGIASGIATSYVDGMALTASTDASALSGPGFYFEAPNGTVGQKLLKTNFTKNAEGNSFLNFQAVSDDAAVAGTAIMSLLHNGKVGIGTTSPKSFLHINRSGVASGIATSYVDGIALTASVTPGSKSGPGFYFEAPNATLGQRLLKMNYTYEAAGESFINFQAVSDDASAAGPVVMSVFHNGKVGIGTATPTSKLQVVGLPVHANNAAAIAAGLTAGAFYHAGDGIVRVVF